MRYLLAECYTFLFKFTRAKLVSYWVALAYISLLMCYTVGGVLTLISGWLSFAGMLLRFFRFPFFVGTLGILFFVIYKVSPNMSQTAKDAKKHSGFTNALVFTFFSLILFVYMKYGDVIFPQSVLVRH